MVFWHLTPLLWSLEHVNKMTNSKWTWSASKWVLIEIFEWGTAMCSLARRIHFLRVCPVCSMCSSPCINILFSIKISYLSTDKLGANWVSVLSLPPWLRIAYVGVSPSLPSASIHVCIQQKKKALLQKPFHNTLNLFLRLGEVESFLGVTTFFSVCLCLFACVIWEMEEKKHIKPKLILRISRATDYLQMFSGILALKRYNVAFPFIW